MSTITRPDRAWKLLKENDWTKGAFAKDKDGIDVPSTSPEAYSFCVVGAINLIYNYEATPRKTKLRNYLTEKHLNYLSLIDWNDEICKSKEEVVGILQELDI